MTCEKCEDRGWNLRDARIDVCDCEQYDPPKWVTRGDKACIATHSKDPDRPRRASVGHLCAGHRAGLEQDIAEMPARFDDLALALHPTGSALKPYSSSSGGGATVNRESGEEEEAAFINDAVTRLRQEIASALTSWAVLVSDEARSVIDSLEQQQWLDPELARRARPPRSASDTTSVVNDIASWLTAGDTLDWIAEQPWCDEPLSHFRELHRTAERLVNPSGRRRVEIAPCSCGGTLVTVTSRTADLLPSVIWCEACGRELPPSQWRQLRKEMGLTADMVLTVAQACDVYGVPGRTMARWVADERLCNVADDGPAMVRASEVEELMRVMGAFRETA